MGTDTKPCNRDFSRYREMSTEELEALLGADFLLDGDGADPELMEYILEVITERDAESIRENVGTAREGWERFSERYLEGQERHEREKRPGRGRRWSRRAAGIAAVFAGLLVLDSAGAYAAGIDLLQVIASWTQETFAFVRPEAESGTGEIPEPLKGLAEELEKYGVKEKVLPSYLPEGYELEKESCDISIDVKSFSCTLHKGSSSIVFSYVLHATDVTDINYGKFQKDNGSPETIKNGGITYYVFWNTEKNIVAWVNGKMECLIYGLPDGEVNKVIKSMG